MGGHWAAKRMILGQPRASWMPPAAVIGRAVGPLALVRPLAGVDTEPSQRGPAYTVDSRGVTRRCCTGTAPEQMFDWRVG